VAKAESCSAQVAVVSERESISRKKQDKKGTKKGCCRKKGSDPKKEVDKNMLALSSFLLLGAPDFAGRNARSGLGHNGLFPLVILVDIVHLPLVEGMPFRRHLRPSNRQLDERRNTTDVAR